MTFLVRAVLVLIDFCENLHSLKQIQLHVFCVVETKGNYTKVENGNNSNEKEDTSLVCEEPATDSCEETSE